MIWLIFSTLPKQPVRFCVISSFFVRLYLSTLQEEVIPLVLFGRFSGKFGIKTKEQRSLLLSLFRQFCFDKFEDLICSLLVYRFCSELFHFLLAQTIDDLARLQDLRS